MGPKNRTRKRRPTPGPNQCHPGIQTKGCIPYSVLKRSAGILGVSVSQIPKTLGIKETDRRSLLMKLPIPDSEKLRLAAKVLRPAMPDAWKGDPDMWLDSNNIRDVMLQYEVQYPEFKFLGPYPIDFATKYNGNRCLINEMCELDLDKEELNGKKKIGIIFNLDPHDKGGSHWVAAFINIPRKTCYYFDSYGEKPPKEIYKFMQWLGIQEPTISLGWNGKRFQYSQTECGMYSMYFIDRMLAGDNYLTFCRSAPPDDFMLDMRDWMFST